MVVVSIVRVTALLQSTQLLQRSLVPLDNLVEVAGTCVVIEVAGLQLHLLLLTPRISVVQTDRTYVGNTSLGAHHHTATAATAFYAEDILE